MRTRGRLATPVLVALLFAGAAGCGGSDTTIRTEDGSATISSDGDKVSVKGSDGSEFSAGQGELPADFPGDVPVPAGEVLSSAKVAPAGEGTGWYLQIQGEGDYSTCFAAEADALLGAGYTEQVRSQAGETISGSYVSPTYQVALVAVAGDGGCQITMTVTAAGS